MVIMHNEVTAANLRCMTPLRDRLWDENIIRTDGLWVSLNQSSSGRKISISRYTVPSVAANH
jgi:hypothetical protein